MAWTTKPPLGIPLDWSNTLNSGLTAFWLFNENSGDKVYDLSGNSNTGTFNNIAFPSTPTSGWNPGILGPAVNFDGIDDYISVPSNPVFNSATGTIAARVKTTTIGTAEYFCLIFPDTNNFIWLFRDNLNKLSLYVVVGGVYVIDMQAVAAMNTTEWYHVAVVQNGTAAKLYINGVIQNLAGTNVGNWSSGFSAWPVFISAVGGGLEGVVDEVRIWNRVLSDTEILSLYTSPYDMFLECPELECSLVII